MKLPKATRECALIKLDKEYNVVAKNEGKFDTTISGILEYPIIILGGTTIADGARVYYEPYKDSCSFNRGGNKYAIIKIKDIMGIERS